jgi:hypothetical protein
VAECAGFAKIAVEVSSPGSAGADTTHDLSDDLSDVGFSNAWIGQPELVTADNGDSGLRTGQAMRKTRS